MSLKFAIPAQTLKKAVSIAARAADKRRMLPIIGYIAIEARDGKLHLTATDLELTLSVAVDDAKIESVGAICVPAAVFDATIKTLSGTDALFALDEKAGRLTLTCGRYKGRLATLPFEEFPVQAKVEGTRIHLPDFKRGIAVVAPASSDEETRPTLQSVYVQSLDESRTTLVAADGYRLARYTLGVQSKGISLLIPANAVEKVIRILDDDIDLTPGKRASIIEGTAGDLTVRATIAIAEGQFPDYQAIMPAPSNARATATVPAQALADAIKRVSVIANEQGTSLEQGKGTLLLSATNGTLQIEGQADQVGNGTDELTATTDGSMTIALGSLFMSDAVSPWKQGQVKLHFYGDRAPLLVLPVGEPAEIVLMPRAG